jgi:hypothetical protein
MLTTLEKPIYQPEEMDQLPDGPTELLHAAPNAAGMKPKKKRKTEVDFLICRQNIASNSLKLINSIKTIEKLKNHDYYSLQD